MLVIDDWNSQESDNDDSILVSLKCYVSTVRFKHGYSVQCHSKFCEKDKLGE